MNKVIILGRLTKDPEIRTTKTEKTVATFDLAVKSNNETDFVPIVVWEKLAELVQKNVFKGHRLLVEGRLRIRSYEDADGQKKRVTEVIAQSIEFIEKKKSEDSEQA